MRLIPSALLALAAAILLRAPAAAQTPEERMRACGPVEPESPLAGVVTDVATGAALDGAVVHVDEYTWGISDRAGCYVVVPQVELEGGRRRVTVQAHRYLELDTVLELSPERTDTLHFALHPAAPACCRLQGEWSLRLTLNAESQRLLESVDTEMEGRIVFSDRLPVLWGDIEYDTLRVEEGRFELDRLVDFSEEEVDGTQGADPRDVVPEDYVKYASGEVFAGDSVLVVLVPMVTDGSVSLGGRIRGDSIRGTWVQNGLCCGVAGTFVMHRVPPSAPGDSLVARGVRLSAQARETAARESAARRLRVGTMRLRVVDARTGRYVRVGIWAQHEEHGEEYEGNEFVYTSGDGEGWSEPEEMEPGRYELFLSTFVCEGHTRVPDEELEENQRPVGAVVVRSREPAEQEIRIDLCAIKAHDFGPVPDGPAAIESDGDKPSVRPRP